MKKKVLVLLSMAFILASYVSGQTAYYWVGGNGTTAAPVSWGNLASWNTSPDGNGTARITPSITDTLIFDGSVPSLASNKVVNVSAVKDSIASLQLRNGITVTIVTTANGNTELAGTASYGATVGACVIPVYGANISKIFKQGDFISTTTSFINMTQIVGINGSDTLYVSSENAPLSSANTNLSIYKATTVYILGNPGFVVDATSIFNFGIGATTTMNSLVIFLNAGATGEIYGQFNFQPRGVGGRLYATSPNSLRFKRGSSCLNGTNHGVSSNPNSTGYVFGNPMSTGSLAAGNFVFVSNGESVIFEGGSTYTHPSIGTGGSTYRMFPPFGVTVNLGSTFPFTPVTAFLPNSNYVINYGNAYPPYFYSGPNVRFGNLRFGGTAVPISASGRTNMTLNAARIDTLTLASTNSGVSGANNGSFVLYGGIVNNNVVPMNFGNVTLAGNATQTFTGSAATSFTNLYVADSAHLSLSNNLTVTGTTAITGRLTANNFSLDGAATGTLSTSGSFSRTYKGDRGASGSITITRGSRNMNVFGIATIPIGTTVKCVNQPSYIPAGTVITAYSSGGNYTLSNAATISDTGYLVIGGIADTLVMNFSSTPATLAISSANGVDGIYSNMTTTTFGASSYVFNNPTTEPFSGTSTNPINIHNLEVNAPVTTNIGTVNLNGTLTLNNMLTLRPSDSLFIKSGNAIVGFGSNKYVDTKVNTTSGARAVLGIERFATERVFPVGTNSHYLPVTITPDSTSNFQVTAFNNATNNGLPNGTVLSSGQLDTAVNANYVINRVYPTTDRSATITLGFPNALKGNTFATYTNQIGISNYNSNAWITPIGSGSNTTNTATASFNNFGSFYVVYNATPTLLPVKFVQVNASKASNATLVQWKVAQELNVDYYVVEKSINGNVFTTVGTIVATGANSYTFSDVSNTQTVYYRIKSVDKLSAAIGYSSVVKLASIASKPLVEVYPNPVTNKLLQVQLQNLATGSLAISLVGVDGRTHFTNFLQYYGGTQLQTLQLPNTVKAGWYQLVVKDGVHETLVKTVLVAQ